MITSKDCCCSVCGAALNFHYHHEVNTIKQFNKNGTLETLENPSLEYKSILCSKDTNHVVPQEQAEHLLKHISSEYNYIVRTLDRGDHCIIHVKSDLLFDIELFKRYLSNSAGKQFVALDLSLVNQESLSDMYKFRLINRCWTVDKAKFLSKKVFL